MILIDKAADVCEIGTKAHTLFNLNLPNTPTLWVVPVSYFSHHILMPTDCILLAEKLFLLWIIITT